MSDSSSETSSASAQSDNIRSMSVGGIKNNTFSDGEAHSDSEVPRKTSTVSILQRAHASFATDEMTRSRKHPHMKHRRAQYSPRRRPPPSLPMQKQSTVSPTNAESRYQKLLDEKEKQLNIKSQKIENNNSWSTETEIIAAEIGEKAQGYVWMHNRNASYLVDWDTRYSNVEIILSILTGTSVFTTLNDCQDLSLVTLVTGIIIYMTAVVRAIHQNRKYPERASAHRLAGSKYSEVYHSVQRQLALYRRDRENAKDYINWITEKFDTLLLSSPGMDDDIRDEYLIKFKNVKFMHPGDLKQIEIKKETPQTSNASHTDEHHPPDDCSSADFSSDTVIDEEMGHTLKRSMTLRSPKIDKKMQYELARYTMR